MKTENPAKLSIITVNFGSKEKVLNLYKSIVKFPPLINWELIVVDNPTKRGGDSDFLAKYFLQEKRIHVIKLSKNLGYGGGNNEGVKFSRGKFIAICNPDTQVLKNTFNSMLEKIRGNSEIGIIVPVLRTNKNKILENCRKFPTIFSLVSRRLFKKMPFIKDKISRKKLVKTDWAQGSFWVMKKEIYQNFAGFDTNFFLFMEDIDLCRRISNSGLEIFQDTESIAIHSPNRLSGGFIGSAIFRKTFWIHLWSAIKYFWKWR